MELIDRTGEINYNIYNNQMIILKYINARNIIVVFENGYKVKSNYLSFKKGSIKSPYDKSVNNIGYLGEGNYKDKINGIESREYTTWSNLLKRCYNKKTQEKHPTYINCTVCSEWHNFQVFAKWFNENYYEVDNEKTHLDKDILIKGNKVYSPKTCCFVSSKINMLFTKSNIVRGDYPIGVSWHKIRNLFSANCNNGNKKKIHLGYFNTPEKAFYEGYKPYKEKLIKQYADAYKDKIPKNLYDALYKYEVEITY